ncbi:ribonuclease Y [Lujinxingia vulgaris]|uniref:Ribonuclease Y n=1 Tax=Lujinxingia vulgaris TaxID=2600176 RepID=A0A5C6X227_9DELT|nr:ribonuclease Y [Lujinxingia vulgaris]TXD32304.1 ribonuclease Y [Lujinxingia vulgaris]
MELMLYLIVGGIIGVVLGTLMARTRAQAQQQELVDQRVEALKDETVESTRRRVESEVRAELTESVRAELVEKFTAEARSEAEDAAQRIKREAEAEADKRIKDAEIKSREVVLAAQKEGEAELKSRRAEQQKIEERLSNRESNLDARAERLDEREEAVKTREQQVAESEAQFSSRELELERQRGEVELVLEKVAGYSAEQARAELVARMVNQAELEANRKIKVIEEQAEEEADKRAQKIISVAVQRYAGDFVAEKCVSVVSLPSDDMKGRIIGREGRNIRALEAASGVDIIIDDTPEAVIVSGFDPVRREIARRSLDKLIADGRIHPTRIEEVVAKTDQEVAQSIKEAGEQAAFELGIHGLHPELIKMVGRLKYRTSYGQNMWSHSIEVGFLCGLMASELGVNVKMARRAGLLHDIGKALTHEQEGSHAIIGADLCRKYGEHEIVRNAVAAHHNDEPQNSVIAHLVIASDALSGARPGARREILETYVKRLEDLERISMGFKGVEKTYAIQAGREIRVMVEHGSIDDAGAFALSRDIARKIEDELTYPGQIKVTVIRETRAIDYAR